MRLRLITILFFIPLVGFSSFPINEIKQETGKDLTHLITRVRSKIKVSS